MSRRTLVRLRLLVGGAVLLAVLAARATEGTQARGMPSPAAAEDAVGTPDGPSPAHLSEP